MTSSATPTEEALAAEPEPTAATDQAQDDEADEADEADEDIAAPGPVVTVDPWWWRNLPRLIALGATLVGWGFIGWHEHFRITPPTVFLCLGWLAVVEAVLYLWRTGFSATDDDPGDVAWWKPVGEADELVREKRSLLKAIKEIEFDHEMGKTTEADAGEMVRMYRARAIEVIKAIDAIEAIDASGKGLATVKDEIERELRARIELKGKSKAKAKRKPKPATESEGS